MQRYVVAGIGTEIGKTVISAILVEALGADYWKPVQSGDLHLTDSMRVEQWVSRKDYQIHPEAYRLTEPMSPHAAAKIDGVRIAANALAIPQGNNSLIIEMAGGLMVPLREDLMNLDILSGWRIPVILVSQDYLGSINHTLLSIMALEERMVPIHGIIFTGTPNQETRSVILARSGLKLLAEIPQAEEINPAFVKAEAEKLQEKFV